MQRYEMFLNWPNFYENNLKYFSVCFPEESLESFRLNSNGISTIQHLDGLVETLWTEQKEKAGQSQPFSNNNNR